MKICFLSFEYPPRVIGGMGVYAEHLVKGLNERGVDVHVITRSEKPSYDHKTYRLFVPEVLYWRRFLFINSAIKFFHNLNKVHKFDLIHLNGTYPIVRSLQLPTVSTLHAIPNIKQAMFRLRFFKKMRSFRDISYLTLKIPAGSIFDFTTVRVSDKIICPSPALARDIMFYCFANEGKIRVIKNGIDLKMFDKIKCFDTSFLNHYDIQKGNFILYVGRLSFEKGVQYLIRAFKIVQKQHPRLKLVIAGSGDLEQPLRNLATNNKGIIFLGHIKSIKIKKLLYDSCIAVILPSIYEVLPTTILEGMASSKSVIASNVGGNSFIIEHGKNGFLSIPNDPVNLAALINTLIEDKFLRSKFGSLGRKLVEKEYTMEKMVTETLRIYESFPN